MAGVHGAAAALRGLELAAAPLGNPIKLLQDELAGRFKEDGSPKHDGLRIGALNANSIDDTDRRDKIESSIQKNEFNIFIVLETKLECNLVSTLEDCSREQKDRRYCIKQNRKKTKTTRSETGPNYNAGGGILIYIDNTVRYKVKSKGEYAESNVEFLHIEITSPVKLHLVALYSPDKVLVDHVISLMSYFLDPLGDRKIMFIGDTNIDMYGGGLGNAFFDVLSREPYKVKQLIEQITHGAACIDHIFTNMEVLESGVMENCITPNQGHKGIYCTLEHSITAHSPTYPDQVQAASPVSNLKVFNQHKIKANCNRTKEIAKLMNRLSDICNSCILAIVCTFEDGIFPPNITFGRHPGSYCCEKEGMYYISVDAVDEMEEKIGLLREAIVEVHKHLKKDVQESKKQCIIFTRMSQTNVFHDLQKKMWYRDWGWDVVWQPRHVEFWDYVLEPSLTHAIVFNGKAIRNKLPNVEPKELKEWELEESSYRYWSEGGSISRLTV